MANRKALGWIFLRSSTMKNDKLLLKL